MWGTIMDEKTSVVDSLNTCSLTHKGKVVMYVETLMRHNIGHTESGHREPFYYMIMERPHSGESTAERYPSLASVNMYVC